MHVPALQMLEQQWLSDEQPLCPSRMQLTHVSAVESQIPEQQPRSLPLLPQAPAFGLQQWRWEQIRPALQVGPVSH
jgi:hypothetical protein